MTREEYREIERHMLNHMTDSAHDSHHIYRVLYTAVDIASHMAEVDEDVLLAACLLHDIGRERQLADPALCHARIGGEMAYEYLLTRAWPEPKALHVKECVASHRYRDENPPASIEAKILFDADKLDASGAVGIARTLLYEGQVGEPLYVPDQNGAIVVEGGGAELSSFFQEFDFKLVKLYARFYTERARELAAGRRRAAIEFRDRLYLELAQNYELGSRRLSRLLSE